MPTADRCYTTVPKSVTTPRKGTTKNPPVKKQVLPPGNHACGFCGQQVYIPDSTYYRRPMYNPQIGFVCLDCTKPKPHDELKPPHHYYVKVERLWGLYTEVVPRHTLTHYGPCMGRGCTHRVLLPGDVCSLVCHNNKQRGPGCVETRVNPNRPGFLARREPDY